jgi:hypothetical protein
MARKSAKKAPKAKRLFAPKLLVFGVMLGWAALNEPASFDTASLAIWGLSALTVALLAGAAVALAAPAAGLFVALVRQAGAGAGARAEEP